MHTINDLTLVTYTDVRFFSRLPVGGRVFHLIPDGRSLLHLCEWSNGRYACPAELSPASQFNGSPIGDTGYRLPGAKHSAGVLNVQELQDGTRVLQVMWATRPPPAPGQTNEQVEGPFYLTFRAFPEIRLPPAPWAALLTRLDAVERALGSAGEGDALELEGRLNAVEERIRAAGNSLRGE